MFTSTLLPLAALVLAGEDLAKVYPATLDYEKDAGGRQWEAGPDDVWSLKSFELNFYGELSIEMKRATVVFGHHDRNVVWAVVIPEKETELDARAAGEDETIRSVFLRFHPDLVGELFPRRTVRGPGPTALVYEGKRVFSWKINAAWQSGNQPVIPWRRSLVVDVATTGKRRMFMIDTDASSVKYERAFEERPLPVPTPITERDAVAAFDETWEAFDREYSGFGLLPDVDWKRLRRSLRPMAADATNAYMAASAIGGLLEPLDDFHAWVAAGNEHVPIARRARPQNASWRGSAALVGGVTETRKDMTWGP